MYQQSISDCHLPQPIHRQQAKVNHLPKGGDKCKYQLLPYLPLTCRYLIEQVCIQYASHGNNILYPNVYHLVSVPIIQPLVCLFAKVTNDSDYDHL